MQHANKKLRRFLQIIEVLEGFYKSILSRTCMFFLVRPTLYIMIMLCYCRLYCNLMFEFVPKFMFGYHALPIYEALLVHQERD